mgnify:FL=1
MFTETEIETGIRKKEEHVKIGEGSYGCAIKPGFDCNLKKN